MNLYLNAELSLHTDITHSALTPALRNAQRDFTRFTDKETETQESKVKSQSDQCPWWVRTLEL